MIRSLQSLHKTNSMCFDLRGLFFFKANTAYEAIHVSLTPVNYMCRHTYFLFANDAGIGNGEEAVLPKWLAFPTLILLYMHDYLLKLYLS